MFDPPHKARAFLEKNGVGSNTYHDRLLSTVAYGPAALVVRSPDGSEKHAVFATYDPKLKKAAEAENRRLTINDLTDEQVTDHLKYAASELLKRSGIYNPTPEQVQDSLAQIRAAGKGRYDSDFALLERALIQQKLGSQGRYQRIEAVEALMDASKQDEKLRAALAPHFGFQPSPEPAPIGKAAAPPVTPAPNLPPAAMPPVNSGAVKPEADNWWTASQPELQNIPVLGGMPRWGLAALGVGVPAGAGLAYHLMAQGQQQPGGSGYAAAVQSMNAY